jgi:streptogramin lyase
VFTLRRTEFRIERWCERTVGTRFEMGVSTMARRFSQVILRVSVGAAVLAAGGVLGTASYSSAKVPPRFSGAPPGSLSCTLSATLKLSPPITTSGGGNNPSTVKGKLSSCTTGNAAVTIMSGKLTGSFARSPINCATLSATGASAMLTIKWKGAVNGNIGGKAYTGRAHFTRSAVSYSGERVVTNGSGDEGFAVPGTGNTSNTIGSFAGGSTLTAYTSDTASALTVACNRKKGVEHLALTGTFTHGVVTTYTDPTISSPLAITGGPDGALWFTNQGNNSIGRITTAGVVSNYTDPSISNPFGIAAGPDGALWFTNAGNNSIGRITTAGVISNYTDPSIVGSEGIAAGPDGALWFTSFDGHSIGRITTAGVSSNYTDPGITAPGGITAGPAGALWFTDSNDSIGRITTAGVISSYTDPSITGPVGITVGADGALWFTNFNQFTHDGHSIGRITTAGVISNYTDPSIAGPLRITAGPDGALWFTNSYDAIGRITTAGGISEYTDPGIVGQEGITAGPDGALWFTNGGGNSIGRVTP